MEELREYKCPCCGGSIEFNSSTQKMKCPYCDSEFDVETIKELNNAEASKQSDKMDWQDNAGKAWEENETDAMKHYICKSCGGEIITDATTAATSCPYCGSTVTMTGNLSGMLKPDFIIPFKLDKKAAKKALCEHYKGKRLLPKVFKDENHIDEIKGMYVPFWIFDADAQADACFSATRIMRTWSDKDYDYTETGYFDIYRSGELSFSGIPVDGSSKCPDDLMDSIEPFDMKDAVDFRTAYLSGYFADKYDVSASESIERANRRIRNTTEASLRNTVSGFAGVGTKDSSIRLSNTKARYALLPVWMLKTKWKNKEYIFAMNGQTGKMVGDLPVDRGLAFKWFAAFSAIFSAVTFAVLSLQFWF